MLTAAHVVPSEIQNLTQNNRDVQMSGIAFMSKAELRKTIEAMCFEQKRLKEKNESLLQEVLMHQKQRNNDLEEIGAQKEKIISLYSRLNSGIEISPLSIAV